MMDKLTSEQCDNNSARRREFREEIPGIVAQLALSCNAEHCFDHVDLEPLPSKESIIDITQMACRLLFPGYFSRARIDKVNLTYYYGQEAIALYEALSEQVVFALRHECRRRDMTCFTCEEQAKEIVINFMKEFPRLRTLLAKDVRAAHDGDPAAKSYDEIIFSYPGLFAVAVHRMAHQLYRQEVPLVPRIMSEYAHSVTGIDIHPGAQIGENFFIDHGTGVVIGETSIIGNHVRIYQGVTFGSLSLSKDEVGQLRDQKRHPTIEDDVIVYSGVTILGGNTVIGAGSIIGGNVWLTHSVPPGSKVFMAEPKLIIE